MITKLRDAKEQLSSLVKRAADGEDIIITIRGQPMARLSSLRPSSSDRQSNAAFADELALLADSVKSGPIATLPQSTWDEIREDRF